jgi:hypothetical protein
MVSGNYTARLLSSNITLRKTMVYNSAMQCSHKNRNTPPAGNYFLEIISPDKSSTIESRHRR